MERDRMDLPAHVEMRGDTVVADDRPAATLNPDASPFARRRFENLIAHLEANDVHLGNPWDDRN